VTVEASGKIRVATGVGTQGQGHFTSFAQIVAEQLGVDITDVHLVTGDTSEFHWGTGTFASRGAVVAGNAIHASALVVRDKVLKLASKVLETPEDELELEGGRVQVADIPMYPSRWASWLHWPIHCGAPFSRGLNLAWKPPSTSVLSTEPQLFGAMP